MANRPALHRGRAFAERRHRRKHIGVRPPELWRERHQRVDNVVLARRLLGVVDIEVRCSSGTYIRSLADDIGRALGGSAHLRNLRRTAVGTFTQDETSPLDAVVVHQPITAVRSMSRVVADEDTKAFIKNGRELDKWDSPSPWVLVDENDALLAIYEASATGRAKPSVVMANAVS